MKKRAIPKSKAPASRTAKAKKLVMVPQNIKDKLLQYVLNPNHNEGKHKAAYFASIGFTQANWEELGSQLIFDPREASYTEETEFGTKYQLIIEISLPGNRGTAVVMTAWISLHDTNEIRLVTCYPD